MDSAPSCRHSLGDTEPVESCAQSPLGTPPRRVLLLFAELLPPLPRLGPVHLPPCLISR